MQHRLFNFLIFTFHIFYTIKNAIFNTYIHTPLLKHSQFIPWISSSSTSTLLYFSTLPSFVKSTYSESKKADIKSLSSWVFFSFESYLKIHHVPSSFSASWMHAFLNHPQKNQIWKFKQEEVRVLFVCMF